MKNRYSKSRLAGIATILLLIISQSLVHSQEFDYPNILAKIKSKQWTSSTGSVTTWINTQNPDGSWSEFQYGKLNTGTTKSSNHLQRLWTMAFACSKKGNSQYGNSACKEAVKKGLDFWHSSNTVDPNWWYNKIYFPQRLGEILIMMREFPGFIPITDENGIDETDILSIFNPQAMNDISSQGAGANAIDIALHYVYRGVLSENANLLVNVRNYISSIMLTNIKSDLCYQDHGPQLHLSSYGWVYCNGLLELAHYLSGSPAEFKTDDENFAVFLQFIRDVQIPSIRGRYWDFSVNGRAVSRPNGLKANLNYLDYLIGGVDPENRTYYQHALARIKGSKPASYNTPQFNRHYWQTDYTQHSRTNYLFTVRNTSKRVVECETGNGENLKAHYFSYGATLIAVDGDEYYNLMPVWDWAMIPGVTCAHTTSFPYRKEWGYNYGSTEFVGGLSDGNYGFSTLDYNNKGLLAKKSWFMFDDEIVCLGAGITAQSSTNVRTTINQCKLNGDAYYKRMEVDPETSVTKSTKEHFLTDLNWVRNGKTAYFFPQKNNVKYTLMEQTGSWKSINSNYSSYSLSEDVFKIWIDHGNNPANADYAYTIVPNITNEAEARAYNQANIEIISNTGSIQAVYNKALDMYQIVFHEKATLQHMNKTITVNHPCLLMLKNGNTFSVADPTHRLSELKIDFKQSGKNYSNSVILPTSEGQFGSSVHVGLDEFTVGIEDILEQHSFKLYPNPTKSFIRLNINYPKTIKYEIRDMLGQIILSAHFSSDTEINSSNLVPGMYLITLFDNNQRMGTRKIVKK